MWFFLPGKSWGSEVTALRRKLQHMFDFLASENLGLGPGAWSF